MGNFRTRVEDVSFLMFPEGSDRWAIYYLKGERVPKIGYIMREGIRIFLCDL